MKGSYQELRKKWQHRFSNYITICCHGNHWSDLAKFRTHLSFYACPYACKYEKDQVKIAEKRKCDDFIFSIISGIFFFRRSMAANCEVHGPISPTFEIFKALMYTIVTCKYETKPIKTVRENMITPFFPL